MDNGRKNKDYDSEPVKFCSKCYSLKVTYEDALGLECCADCGSSEISEASLEEWEKKYVQRYGHKLVVKNEDPRKTYIFKHCQLYYVCALYASANISMYLYVC